jgi:hypothetical protein
MTRIRFDGFVLSLDDEAPRYLHVTIASMFRRFFDRIADTWIPDLAAGIALGFAALEFVRSIFSAVIQFWTQKEPEGESSFPDLFSEGLGSLAFEIDGRPVYLAPIVESGLTLLAVTGLVVLFLRALTPHENVA